MKAKEKAKELVDMFYNIDSDSKIYDDFTMKIFYAQRCALISVDEILEFHDRIDVKYWKEVKQEINKI
jgi:hypothetical protein